MEALGLVPHTNNGMCGTSPRASIIDNDEIVPQTNNGLCLGPDNI